MRRDDRHQLGRIPIGRAAIDLSHSLTVTPQSRRAHLDLTSRGVTAEVKDIPGWVNAFAQDGTFTDMSTGVTYRGETLGDVVEIYGTAFSDMHRELHRFYPSNDVVVVQLALQGTQDGPLTLPTGTIPATGRRMDAPCCDVFELVDGKIKRFDCYPSGTVIMSQLGVLDSA